LRELSTLCAEHGALLIVDEIMTGLGRTGALFASVEAGCVPDLLCLGKALGGGLPTSACLGRAEVMAAWGTPDKEALHTATFLGNPLLSAAALAALDVMEAEDLALRAAMTGKRWLAMLRAALADHDMVREVRGAGLLLGVVLHRPGLSLKLVQLLLMRGYITVPAGAQADVLSLTPPLTITAELCDGFVEALVDVMKELT
jgi:4-aminobutyrate aminotransferase/(S)-3-amino-2-methylpropionate transaminase